ncbi:MAG TPA: hypothetical protein VGN84_00860 [Solirubrobacterales bacterium]|jgi:Tfp pilus assembly protein PilV|nr:hypothetical protein [Solirubrobacterales bacterium]
MTRVRPIQDERGVTLIELIVTLAVGMVILFALSMVIIVSLRETDRVSARVGAVQQARSSLYYVVNELHSACISPQVAPVQEESTGTSLTFYHQAGSAIVPTPIKSTVSLSEGTLTQSDFKYESGTAPKEWKFAKKAYSSRQLVTGIGPTPPSSSIFSYFIYINGQLSAPLTTLNFETTPRVVAVHIAYMVAPSTTPVFDPHAAASVQNTALLRLTPPSFNTSAVNLPCQ